MMAHLYKHLDPIPSSTKKKKTKDKQTVVEFGPRVTKLSGSALVLLNQNICGGYTHKKLFLSRR